MKQKIRGLVSLGLLIFWTISALSGVVLYFAPEGQRSGRSILLFNLSKSIWAGIHTWISFFALGITLLHVILDFNILIVMIRSLFKTNN